MNNKTTNTGFGHPDYSRKIDNLNTKKAAAVVVVVVVVVAAAAEVFVTE